jgi:reverse transcriptase-like protein
MTLEARKAFIRLKEIFITLPLLRHFDPAPKIREQALLSHDNGKWHPVEYLSRKTLPAESDYPIHENRVGLQAVVTLSGG